MVVVEGGRGMYPLRTRRIAINADIVPILFLDLEQL